MSELNSFRLFVLIYTETCDAILEHKILTKCFQVSKWTLWVPPRRTLEQTIPTSALTRSHESVCVTWFFCVSISGLGPGPLRLGLIEFPLQILYLDQGCYMLNKL